MKSVSMIAVIFSFCFTFYYLKYYYKIFVFQYNSSFYSYSFVKYIFRTIDNIIHSRLFSTITAGITLRTFVFVLITNLMQENSFSKSEVWCILHILFKGILKFLERKIQHLICSHYEFDTLNSSQKLMPRNLKRFTRLFLPSPQFLSPSLYELK